MVADGRCDFIAAVAEQLPVQVFLRMMGLPVERLEQDALLGLLDELEQAGVTVPILPAQILPIFFTTYPALASPALK